MSTNVLYNGVTYSVPSFGDIGYAQGPGNLSQYLVALATALPVSGGTLSGPITFSIFSNPASSGSIRFSHSDTIDWRNFANSANLALGVNNSDQLTFNGAIIATTASSVTSVSGTANQITSTGGTTPVLALANPLITPGPVTITGDLSFSPTTEGIVGTTTANDASSGIVGEYTSSYNAGTNSTGTGQWFDLTSIVLNQGDWDVSAEISFNIAGATATKCNGAISTSPGNTAVGLVSGDNWLQTLPGNASTDTGVTIAAWRMSTAAPVNVYLKANWAFSAGTPNSYGRISARRVR